MAEDELEAKQAGEPEIDEEETTDGEGEEDAADDEADEEGDSDVTE